MGADIHTCRAIDRAIEPGAPPTQPLLVEEYDTTINTVDNIIL